MNIARCSVRPDAEKNTVVVEGKRELLPVEYEEPIPTWPLGPLWWGLKTHAELGDLPAGPQPL